MLFHISLETALLLQGTIEESMVTMREDWLQFDFRSRGSPFFNLCKHKLVNLMSL